MHTVTAFRGTECIATGGLPSVAVTAKRHLDRDPGASVLVFDDRTGAVIDLDYRGTLAEFVERLNRDEPPKRPGRPKLGVIAREITLLPRHWEWLASQPGGASVALRKLVEHAMRDNRDRDAVRRAQEAAYRFITTMAGNEPGYEEAIRALFAGDSGRLRTLIEPWPADVRKHAAKLAAMTD